jgi:hypothetical protein
VITPTVPSATAMGDLQPPPPATAQLEVLPPFFAVSRKKLVVMMLCSFNFYAVFWFYMNWRRIRDREPGINPALRSLLAAIFCYPCFARIQRHGRTMGLSLGLHAAPAAILWVLLQLMGQFESPLWWVPLLAVLPMLPIQSLANAINAREVPAHERNDRFSGWNWLLLLAGGGTLMLAVLGALIPGT